MNAILLMAAGEAPLVMLDRLSAALARAFRVSCRVSTGVLDVSHAHNATRGQYHSTAILEKMQEFARDDETRLLGVTGHDLYVPVLSFVFGEAQLAGPGALVSFHRLREEFYGLPANAVLLQERLIKEAVHELGHTFGLRHCSDWRCVMASTHAVERLDLKTAGFCPACRRVVEPALPASSPVY